MFICFCETFLHEGIVDSEVQIPGFIIVRSDRVFRWGMSVFKKKSYLQNLREIFQLSM